ncbi:MAG TPA: GH1 family beta-glucosidase [Solirubrobacteraceae bacterium]|jgi:beta-glucosidase|nr:GH1 family beta-glucosidase [Solirubrobacteraceae bacterium]
MSTISHNSDAPRARRFPEGFVWGVGTSSYQIEGAVDADGRGRSIWDVFSHAQGNVHHGDTGDIACDSYHRLEDDLRLLSGLGVGAYRFSVSWPRVLPTGAGAVNQAGLDYYRRLVERLNEHGITPVATVYHWDLPQALEERGGWASRETAERLGELARVLAEALGDQVGMWVTINEPLQTVHQGYRTGTHAPGRRDHKLAAAAIHHILIGHGYALQALRASLPEGVPIGTTMDPQPFIALGEDAEAVVDELDAEQNRVYLDPVLRGAYPVGLRDDMRPPDALIEDDDLALISAPIDFFGVNYYRPHYIRRGDWSDLRQGEIPVPEHAGFVEYLAPDLDRTVMGWPIVPSSLRDLLARLHVETGGLPLYITENGCAADDYVTPEGVVEDHERIAYIHSHLDAALQAVDDGVNVAGYFHWSLMDNFEWAEGYRRRFGLHYIEFDTGRRIPKRSAHFYRRLTQTGELPPLADLLPADEPVAGVPEAPATV